jgi:replication initiation protein RepC
VLPESTRSDQPSLAVVSADVIQLADRLVAQNSIHRYAWHEARRGMGQRGAAASVIAALYKYQTGEVRHRGPICAG